MRIIMMGMLVTAQASCGAMVTELGNGWTADGAPVTVPHCWNQLDGSDGEGWDTANRLAGYSSGATGYVRRAVLYRTTLPAVRADRRYFLRFPAASTKATVCLNGMELGRHDGGFTGFTFEATAAMKKDGANDLAVTVDSAFDPDVQSIHADFTTYGGLYRTPELIETGSVAIDRVTDGGKGVVIEADPKTGDVTARVKILGGGEEIRRFHFDCPELWTPENPKLYTVTVRVGPEGDGDEETIRFGFRTCEFRADGFYLNGVKRQLRGVCRHMDREGRGWARTKADQLEDVRWMKLMGADAVRTSHYPQGDDFYDLCDENGLLVWTELPNVNGLTFTERARQNELKDAREMVAQFRNHPSIFCWGIFNELYNKPMPMDGRVEVRMTALKEYIERLDPSRRTVAASNDAKKTAINAVPSEIGFNLYPGWYGGESSEMDKAIGEAFARNAGRTSVAVSEYGCGGCVEQHADAKYRDALTTSRFHPEEYQAWHHHGNYRAIVRDGRIWGSFLWVMFDLASDCRFEGFKKGMNDKGLVTWDRDEAKDAFYFYKANWNSEPMLHLVGAKLSETHEATATVMAFSNVGKVRLRVNGRFVGDKEVDEVKTALWEDVPLEPGMNEIEVISGNYRKHARWNRTVRPFPKVKGVRRLTSGPKDHFFANYFAINAWSPGDNRYVAVLETDINGRLPAANERITLGLVDTRDGNRFIPVTTTACWNFQEATMFHWLPGEPDTFVFNDLRDGRAVAVVMNWKTGSERILPQPVSAVSRDGTKAVSINYSRLYLTRPDYGYAGDGQDSRKTVEWPEDDGLWVMDLKTGEAKLVLSVAQGRGLMLPTKRAEGKPGNPLAYYCHTVLNPDATRIFFLARSVDWFNEKTHEIPYWNTTSFTVDIDGGNLRKCFPQGDWGGSHFNWKNNDEMVVTVWPKELPGRSWHMVFKVGEEDKGRRIGKGLIDWDGHCSYSPNREWMSTEGYFDGTFLRNWVLMRVADEACLPIGSFYVPEAYRGGYWRCDLHSRWRPDGRALGFNSVHEGSRQVYVVDLDNQ